MNKAVSFGCDSYMQYKTGLNDALFNRNILYVFFAACLYWSQNLCNFNLIFSYKGDFV